MTILFSPSFLGDPNKDISRFNRQESYLKYYKQLKTELGYDKILLLDSGSDIEYLKKHDARIVDEWGRVIKNKPAADVTIVRFHTELPRTGVWEYPYWWRCLDFLKVIIPQGVTKLIHIDTDCYVLSPRLMKYVRELDSGWTAFWSAKYDFPEAGFWVVAGDALKSFIDFPIPYYTYYNGKEAERVLPFTNVVKSFIGDRYGEDFLPQTPEMDYYCQHQAGCPKMVYNLGKKD